MRNFILGTDWWTDCDDAVAIRLLTRAHKSREICIKGIGINACMECSAASLEGFLNLEKVRDIPIGIDLDATDFGGTPPYQHRLSAFSEKYHSNNDACDAVRLYREILANSREKLEIIEIGYLQVISNVLKSLPDDISPLNGIGNNRSRQAGSYFCMACPVPVTFLGFEIGLDVFTGGTLDKDDVLYKVLCDHGSPNERYSWDPMLAMMAVIGDEQKAGYDVVRGVASVDEHSGANNFKVDEKGRHLYVVKKRNNEYYVDLIHRRIKSM